MGGFDKDPSRSRVVSSFHDSAFHSSSLKLSSSALSAWCHPASLAWRGRHSDSPRRYEPSLTPHRARTYLSLSLTANVYTSSAYQCTSNCSFSHRMITMLYHSNLQPVTVIHSYSSILTRYPCFALSTCLGSCDSLLVRMTFSSNHEEQQVYHSPFCQWWSHHQEIVLVLTRPIECVYFWLPYCFDLVWVSSKGLSSWIPLDRCSSQGCCCFDADSRETQALSCSTQHHTPFAYLISKSLK